MVPPDRSATSMSIQHVCKWVLHLLGREQSFFSAQRVPKRTIVSPFDAMPDMKFSSVSIFVIAALVGSVSASMAILF